MESFLSPLVGGLLIGASNSLMLWGLLGICPGPGIVNFVTLRTNSIVFVICMTLGMGIFKIFEKVRIL